MSGKKEKKKQKERETDTKRTSDIATVAVPDFTFQCD